MTRSILIMTLLVLTPALYADETTSAPVERPSTPLRLAIQAGKISADFKDVPVKTVLEEVRRQSGIDYRVSAELASSSISATVEDLPLEQGLALILAPFNYMIAQDKSTPPRQVVHLLGLKENRQSPPTASPLSGPAATARPDTPPQAPELSPSPAGPPGVANTGGASELPPFIPKVSPQGPPNAAPTKPLPDFTPISNTTGPVAPSTQQHRELPPFTPVTNQTGPVPHP